MGKVTKERLKELGDEYRERAKDLEHEQGGIQAMLIDPHKSGPPEYESSIND